MQLSLNYKPRNWQDVFHRTRTHYAVLAVCRRAGKTKAALMDLADAAMRFTLDRGLFAYIAPLRTQAKQIAWAELKSTLRHLIVTGHVTISESELSVTFWNGAIIKLFGSDDPDSLRGFRFDRVVMDEVAQMKSDVWSEVVMPACQDRDAPVLFIGTPKGVDLFSELFYKGLRGANPKWSSHRWTIYDVGIFTPAKIEEIRGSMSEKAFAREFLCDFEAGAEDQLISFADVQLASQRVATLEMAFGAPVILGVDPARFGDDRTVIVRRQGVVAYPPIIINDADNMEVASAVALEINKHNPAAVFIDIGQGAGVVDRLRQLGYPVIEVPFGGKAHKSELYFNRRSEMWAETRDWLRAGGVLPDDLGLKQELCAPTYTFDPRGRIKLESKDDILTRIPEMSPDKADALALTFASPVAAPTLESELRRRIPNLGNASNDEPEAWNPWA
jgi:hypothetical protein